MSQKLAEALTKLDPKNDAHWTENGLPSIATIKELSGENFSRKQITEASPHLTRESLLANLSVTTPEQTPPSVQTETKPELQVETKPEDEDEDDAPPKPAEAKPLEQVEAEVGEARSELAGLQAEIQKIDSKIHNLQISRASLVSRSDQLLEDIEATKTHQTNQMAIMRHLERQHELRVEQAENRRLLNEQLAASPLDAALAARGRNRRR